MLKLSLKKVKHQMRLAFNFYCNNQYSEAINHYKEALSYLDWVSAELDLPYFYSNYPKILNIFSDIWKHLGEIYHKIGNLKEEAISLAQEKYFLELDAAYKTNYLRFKNSKHEELKKVIKNIEFMIIIELFLLFSGLTMSFIFVHLRLFVNLIYFLVDFMVFLLLFIWIKRSFEIRAEYKQLPVIFCAGLRESFLDYTEGVQRFIDRLAWNIFSVGFWVLILSLVFLFFFINNFFGNSGGDLEDYIRSYIFPAGYISITLLALIMDILLHHWNDALIWRRINK